MQAAALLVPGSCTLLTPRRCCHAGHASAACRTLRPAAGCRHHERLLPCHAQPAPWESFDDPLAVSPDQDQGKRTACMVAAAERLQLLQQGALLSTLHAAVHSSCMCAQGEVVPDPSEREMNPDVWASKPAWCQPWTILLTGSLLVGLAWLASRSPIWTSLAAVPVLAWWTLFLVVMPKQYRQYAEQVNQRTAQGLM